MKVLLVILHANPARGGAEAYTVRLLHKLRQRGIEALIAASTFATEIPVAWRVPLQHGGLTRSARYRRFLDSLDAHLAEARCDIVHAALPVRRCDVYHPHAGVEALTLARASCAQRLFNRRRRRFARVEREMLAARPIVLCLSERSRQALIDKLAVDADRAVTLYSAPDESRFVPGAMTPEHALFIGQDFHRKGLDIAIAAVEQVEGLSLTVVGDDARPSSPAAAQVRFVGRREDVAGELARASCLIHPARHEPFGMVIVEAMLMGVPPIVSRASGASEIVRDGIDGRIVEGEDPHAWASAMRDVLARRDEMSRACLARREELSYGRHLDKLLAIYDRILQHGKLST